MSFPRLDANAGRTINGYLLPSRGRLVTNPLYTVTLIL
jgi:hypothetical protein